MSKRNLYINGRWVEGNGSELKSVNPATDLVLWQKPSASQNDVNEAVHAAREAFEPWSSMNSKLRIIHLKKFAKDLTDTINEIAEVISLETGKPLWESLTEVSAMVNKIEISISAHKERCHEMHEPYGAAKSYRRFKAHGVIVVFGPFNLPGHLPNGHIVPALLAGNTIVFKPSEKAPLVAEKMVRIWDKVGLPKGVLNLVQGGKQTGVDLINHKDIDGVYFTGSYEVGAQIHSSFAGRPEKILALEMGGNNPLIVDQVKNTIAASYMTIQSAFITSGQRCVCARRLIVLNGKEGDFFLRGLVKMTNTIRIGAFTIRPEPFMGPVISHDVVENLLSHQEKLANQGGTVLIEMEKIQGKGSYITPGIMDVTDMKNKEDNEIFGPFLQVVRVKDFQDAIKEANNTSYGLSAGLISDDQKKYRMFYEKSRAGIINFNAQITGASSKAPFGGIGRSGNHRPSAYFAADYCEFPVASIETDKVSIPGEISPGISID